MALRGREDLGHQLTHFQPAGRGTQNASPRVGWTSSAHDARPGCSRRPGLRETKGKSQPLPTRHAPRAPRAVSADWQPLTG